MHCIPRPVTLSAGLLALTLLSFGAAAQSARPDAAAEATSGDATALAKNPQNPVGDLNHPLISGVA